MLCTYTHRSVLGISSVTMFWLASAVACGIGGDSGGFGLKVFGEQQVLMINRIH